MVRTALLLLALVAACSAGWVDIFKAPWTKSPLELALAISCPNTEACFIAGSHGDDAVAIYEGLIKDDLKVLNKSIMAGHSVLILAMAMHGRTGATAGLGALKDPGMLFTANTGHTWHSSHDLNLVTGQDMELMRGGVKDSYAFIGSTGFGNGVAVSHDGGARWKSHDWAKSLKIPAGATARYGSFPSQDTWYVTGGSFPGGNNSFDGTIHTYGAHLHFNKTSNKHQLGRLPAVPGAPTSGYSGVITKTTDGGKTWEVQFSSVGKFYFNDVHCWNTELCVAVAEGFSDGAAPGARIMVTTDGGKTWVQKYFDTDTHASMMWVRMTSENEIWVAGSSSKGALKQAIFWSSTDKGSSWTKNAELDGLATVLSLDFVNKDLGFATAITQLEITTFLKYSN